MKSPSSAFSRSRFLSRLVPVGYQNIMKFYINPSFQPPIRPIVIFRSVHPSSPSIHPSAFSYIRSSIHPSIIFFSFHPSIHHILVLPSTCPTSSCPSFLPSITFLSFHPTVHHPSIYHLVDADWRVLLSTYGRRQSMTWKCLKLLFDVASS